MTSETKPDVLLWVDVETTSIKPLRGQLLEVGMLATDMQGCRLGDLKAWTIHHDRISLTKDTMYAVDLHTRNKLIEQSFESSESTACVSVTIQTYLRALADKYTLHPAGTNVDFDLTWLDSKLDLKLDMLHYRKLDMSSLRMVIQELCLGAYAHQPTTHRVEDCISSDIDEYRDLLRAFGQMLDKDMDDGTGEKA